MTPAGPVWVDRYPTSRSVDDLAEPFRGCVVRFLSALAEKGCRVHIAATRRPAERAWLMQGAWDVAKGTCRPDEVRPHDPPIDILWTLDGARAMVALYGLVHRPSLTSRHIDGLAIDMTIDGMPLADAVALGAGYEVHHLASDPVHWSSDGH